MKNFCFSCHRVVENTFLLCADCRARDNAVEAKMHGLQKIEDIDERRKAAENWARSEGFYDHVPAKK